MTTLGFDEPLYILPFDQHQTAEIAAAKRVIYDAFKAAV